MSPVCGEKKKRGQLQHLKGGGRLEESSLEKGTSILTVVGKGKVKRRISYGITEKKQIRQKKSKRRLISIRLRKKKKKSFAPISLVKWGGKEKIT